ncbi:Puromycin-sensitive aminopeptidase-like 2, partial [Homarus americanus]
MSLPVMVVAACVVVVLGGVPPPTDSCTAFCPNENPYPGAPDYVCCDPHPGRCPPVDPYCDQYPSTGACVKDYPCEDHQKCCPNACVSYKVKEATKQIKFNTLDLTLRDIKVKLSSGEDLVPASTEISTTNEMVTLTFEETLPIGSAKLSVAFDGELNDKMKGMYRSRYT